MKTHQNLCNELLNQLDRLPESESINLERLVNNVADDAELVPATREALADLEKRGMVLIDAEQNVRAGKYETKISINYDRISVAGKLCLLTHGFRVVHIDRRGAQIQMRPWHPVAWLCWFRLFIGNLCHSIACACEEFVDQFGNPLDFWKASGSKVPVVVEHVPVQDKSK